MARLVAVLGYSTRRGHGLHPICAARLKLGERVAQSADAVVLSGWSRRRQQPSEGELMREAWRGPDLPLLVDGDARTTLGNARAVASVAAELGVTDVVLVTSSWHARRARLLVRAALGPEIGLEVVTPARTRPPFLVGRELACLAALPLQRVRAGSVRRPV